MLSWILLIKAASTCPACGNTFASRRFHASFLQSVQGHYFFHGEIEEIRFCKRVAYEGEGQALEISASFLLTALQVREPCIKVFKQRLALSLLLLFMLRGIGLRCFRKHFSTSCSVSLR